MPIKFLGKTKTIFYMQSPISSSFICDLPYIHCLITLEKIETFRKILIQILVSFPSPGALPDPGIRPRSPALQADSLPAEPPGKPKYHSKLL